MFVGVKSTRTRWSGDTIADCLRALERELSYEEVEALTGVPAATVRTWDRGRVPQAGIRSLLGCGSCAACGAAPHDLAALKDTPYLYVLGVYLGDGVIYMGPRTTSLRISCDVKYPGLISEMVAAIGTIRGRDPHVGKYRRCECAVITSYWKSWPCLLPQHGAGRKHHRSIVLEPWQRDLIEDDPRGLIRGLVHTDGWRGVNRARVKGRDYAYPRYQFSNRSDDIRRIFTDACDLLGIEWRPWGRWHISVARRDSVAALDEFVGLKT
jgi:hypothetical protein